MHNRSRSASRLIQDRPQSASYNFTRSLQENTKSSQLYNFTSKNSSIKQDFSLNRRSLIDKSLTHIRHSLQIEAKKTKELENKLSNVENKQSRVELLMIRIISAIKNRHGHNSRDLKQFIEAICNNRDILALLKMDTNNAFEFVSPEKMIGKTVKQSDKKRKESES